MPQRKWLLIEPDRGINQEEWLINRIKKDLDDPQSLYYHSKSLSLWASSVAHDFEDEFPRTIRKTIVEGRGKKRTEREETEEEAKERTEKRSEVRSRLRI
jgi:hypothetical protein